MLKWNVIGYEGEVIGEVGAIDAVEAWSEANKKFDEILDVRQVEVDKGREGKGRGWVEGPFEWYSPTKERILLSGKMWSNEYDDMIAVTQLIPDLAKDLREDLEPEEYSGVIEEGNIVVMVGDVDGFHNIKAFPSFDEALGEARGLREKFPMFEGMDVSGYLDSYGYLALAIIGA